mmetsp:Transcript_1207/g.2913  ORF Transcript_1207/g.2913 Transcript_1207/m.2913 type:complete len:239 (+) Transcript_1207:100-816(+)
MRRGVLVAAQASKMGLRRPVVASRMPVMSFMESANVRSARFFSTEDKPKAEETPKEAPEQAAEAAPEPSEAEKQVAELSDKVKGLEEQLKEAKDTTLRTLAEMENLRQRTTKDIENRTTYANSKFAKSLLDVADNLERALASVPAEALEKDDANHLKSLHEGISMTETELLKVFKANGITGFGEVGEPFDPHMHEAFFQMPNPELKHNSIAQVLKKGYKFKERVIRPAQVGTVNNPSS